MNAVISGYIGDIEGVDAFKTADVVSVLVRAGTALVMGIDAAVGAEVVLGGVGIELIKLQVFFALDDADAIQGHGCDNRALAPAYGAIATSGADDAVR